MPDRIQRAVRENPVEKEVRLDRKHGKCRKQLKIRVGFEMVYQCPQPTPMILTLNIHYSRASDLEQLIT
jgi:hypothetical protein